MLSNKQSEVALVKTTLDNSINEFKIDINTLSSELQNLENKLPKYQVKELHKLINDSQSRKHIKNNRDENIDITYNSNNRPVKMKILPYNRSFKDIDNDISMYRTSKEDYGLSNSACSPLNKDLRESLSSRAILITKSNNY